MGKNLWGSDNCFIPTALLLTYTTHRRFSAINSPYGVVNARPNGVVSRTGETH